METGRSQTRLRAFMALGLSSVFCLLLLAARPRVVGTGGHLYLVWNLFLAWIPFVVALVVYDRTRQGRRDVVQLGLFGVWLAFLPNAPYIVTDLIHLPSRAADPLWFDALLYLAFAWTGLMLGIISMLLVHRSIARAYGPASGWGVIAGATVLCGVGIYLGRFLRWNSWDVVTNPSAVLGDLAAIAIDPFGPAMAIAATFAAFMAVGYLAVYSVTQLRE